MRQLCNGVQRNIASQQIFRICVKLRQPHDIPLIIGISSRFLGLWRDLPGVVRRAVSARDRYSLTDIFNRILSEIFGARMPGCLQTVSQYDKIKADRQHSVRKIRRIGFAPGIACPSWRCKSHSLAVRVPNGADSGLKERTEPCETGRDAARSIARREGFIRCVPSAPAAQDYAGSRTCFCRPRR